jgi:disulfide bond formation protein DsbB
MVEVPITIQGRITMSDVQATPVRSGGTPYQPPTPTEIRVVGFNMPFLNLVGFFIKAALAAVPAAIIVAVIWLVVAAVFVGGFAGRHV